MSHDSESRVMVSGCFDLLHSGHVAFLTEAAEHGRLTVCIGSDKTVFELKGRRPINDERERAFMLRALACVDEVRISRGSGYLDFLPELEQVQPQVFFVNFDGDTSEKRQAIESRSIQYIVAERTPHQGLIARSTTDLRKYEDVPFRLDLAGGWLDQPFVSKLHPGPVITISLEPEESYETRSGMATSTRNAAKLLWGPRMPIDDRDKLAKLLFAFENPPGTKEVAGSQDAIGIVFPGLNRLDYDGEYWPTRIESVHKPEVLEFIESHLYLKYVRARPGEFVVLAEQKVSQPGAEALSQATQRFWEAALRCDAQAAGQAMTDSFHAQTEMFPLMRTAEVDEAVKSWTPGTLGHKISGAGGGGYLVLFSEQPVPDAIRPCIRRES